MSPYLRSPDSQLCDEIIAPRLNMVVTGEIDIRWLWDLPIPSPVYMPATQSIVLSLQSGHPGS